MSPAHLITMLKFIKNLSMLSTTLDPLQNSNAIDVLTDLLRVTMKRGHFREVSNQILNTIYNMCRLNKGLAFYISLLADPYWQVTALDAIFTWFVSDSSPPFLAHS